MTRTEFALYTVLYCVIEFAIVNNFSPEDQVRTAAVARDTMVASPIDKFQSDPIAPRRSLARCVCRSAWTDLPAPVRHEATRAFLNWTAAHTLRLSLPDPFDLTTTWRQP